MVSGSDGYQVRKSRVKSHVKVMQGLVLTNSHVFSEMEESKESPKGDFLIDAAVMRALEPLGMTGIICL